MTFDQIKSMDSIDIAVWSQADNLSYKVERLTLNQVPLSY